MDFRCPADNALLAVVDEHCPRVQVKCQRCKQVREYVCKVDKRPLDVVPKEG